ncbi:MAG: YgiT-type zinc finger protein [Spirochaetia bacterium]|nr:YgiT-type zinc finger protein [Spirochaetia bacterium]
MEYIFCKGKLEKKTAPFTVERKDYQIHYNALPAFVCVQCGEPVFEENALALIQKSVKSIEEEKLRLAV